MHGCLPLVKPSDDLREIVIVGECPLCHRQFSETEMKYWTDRARIFLKEMFEGVADAKRRDH